MDFVFKPHFFSFLLDKPTPKNISYYWNFGSLLGLFLGLQILTGLFLSFFFFSFSFSVFDSLDIKTRDSFGLSLLRGCHSNGASFFFIFLYFHIFRGVFYKSYRLYSVWLIGCFIYYFSMAVAFLGYVLPWGQMSFWGATVITNLFSAIPYVGGLIVSFLLGGFSISSITLSRFFCLHFILPFLILFLVIIHVVFLHLSGSSNPLGISSSSKIFFYGHFIYKDYFGFFIFLFLFSLIIIWLSHSLEDIEKFYQANPLVTPLHIVPEWYFLPAYAILRAFPSKISGIIFFILFLASFLLVSFFHFFFTPPFKSHISLPSTFIFLLWLFSLVLLGFIGGLPVDYLLIHSTYFLFFIFLFSLFWMCLF